MRASMQASVQSNPNVWVRVSHVCISLEVPFSDEPPFFAECIGCLHWDVGWWRLHFLALKLYRVKYLVSELTVK